MKVRIGPDNRDWGALARKCINTREEDLGRDGVDRVLLKKEAPLGK